MTDENGAFELSVAPNQTLIVSCIGYKDYSRIIGTDKNNYLHIELEPSQYQLSEVQVKPKKEKYTKKGNPAVAFVEKIIRNRNSNDPKNKDYYSFQHYQKLTYAINNFDSLQQKKMAISQIRLHQRLCRHFRNFA
jgi:hypothetical protein